MHIQLKLIAGILSLLIGVVFASPLLFYNGVIVIPSHITPEGPKPDVEIEVAYADFKVEDPPQGFQNPPWITQGENASILTYNAILNITNYGDKNAVIKYVGFIAGKDVTSSLTFFSSQSSGREATSALVDGKLYNITLASAWATSQNSWPHYDHNSGNVILPQNILPDRSVLPIYKQGVQIFATYLNGVTTKSWLNMNGTWTDVTGRINATGGGPMNTAVVKDPVVSETRWFQSASREDRETDYNRDTYTIIGEGKFSNIWQPNESRLIFLNGTRTIRSSRVEILMENQLVFKAQANTRLEDENINGTQTNTSAMIESVNRVQLETKGELHIYNSALRENNTFQMDQFNVEVFVNTRS